jgi:hypothetical protein
MNILDKSHYDIPEKHLNTFDRKCDSYVQLE